MIDDHFNAGKISVKEAATICQRIEGEFRARFPYDKLGRYGDSQQRIDFKGLKKYLEEHCLNRIGGEFSPFAFLKVCWDYYYQHEQSKLNAFDHHIIVFHCYLIYYS